MRSRATRRSRTLHAGGLRAQLRKGEAQREKLAAAATEQCCNPPRHEFSCNRKQIREERKQHDDPAEAPSA